MHPDQPQPQHQQPDPAWEKNSNDQLQQEYQQPYYPQQQQPHIAHPAWQSPVAQHAQVWPQHMHHSRKSNAWIWALLGAFGAVTLAIGGLMLFKTGADPLRTLEEFPIESYLRNHEAVLGSRFRAELILDADLGGELGKGRMFSFRSQSTGRLLPILIPDNIGQSVFDKGQRYQLELEVRTGGIIYANSCRKS